MSLRQPQYSKEEFARLGDEIYQRDIYPQLQSDNAGKIVAIDIATGAWEIDDDEISACSRLEKRYPNAQIWIVKVGSRYVRRFGASRSQKAKTA
jgi:frataxin-like iron-binding protein CyaY